MIMIIYGDIQIVINIWMILNYPWIIPIIISYPWILNISDTMDHVYTAGVGPSPFLESQMVISWGNVS